MNLSLSNEFNINIVNVYSLKHFFSLLNKKIVAISLLSHEARDWGIFFLLRIANTPLIYINNLSTPVEISAKHTERPSIPVKTASQVFFSKTLPALVYVFFTRIGLFQKINTVYVSNKMDYVHFRSRKYYKRVVLINSKSYDYYLEDNKKDCSEEFIVFIDSMLPYHGDQVRLGFPPPDRRRYYQALNLLFDSLECFLGLETVICAHPKYNMKFAMTDFGKRTVVERQTNEYIKRSKVVLFHESSAVNTAIVYDKNIIQISSSSFNKFIKNNCKAWEERLGVNILDLDSYSVDDFDKLFNHRSKREKYLRGLFIKENLIPSGKEGVSGYSQITEDMVSRYERILMS